MQKSEIKPAPIELELPSGAVAVILDKFKGKHIRKAQAISGGDSNLIIYSLIAQLTQIDGASIVMEDLDEMDGRDVLVLMTHYNEAFQ
jgi:hypothetical protein